jgi:hypothetical protein
MMGELELFCTLRFLQRLFTVDKQTFRLIEKFAFPFFSVLHAVIFYVFDEKIHFKIFYLRRLIQLFKAAHRRESWALSD